MRKHIMAVPNLAAKASPLAFLGKLHTIKLGSSIDKPESFKMKRADLAYVLRNLATLVDNGLSLPRSLETLAREKGLKKYAPMLISFRRKLEAGESFSSALEAYPKTFPDIIVNQIRVGERSGTIGVTLGRIASQLEKSGELVAKILKRLSYPIVVTVAGSGIVAFMLTYVVPQFEETYTKAKIALPAITQFLISVGHLAKGYGWLMPLLLIALVAGFKQARKNKATALKIDRTLLNIPVLGDWLRDLAMLQFMDVLGIMMESGFKLVDALAVSAGSVSNHAIRAAVNDLGAAVSRGEKLSREVDRHGNLFPPVVSQLVIIGEETGNLAKSTGHVREHLRRQIERKADVLVGALEPILTLFMATAIGVILLAVYMPMFSMVDAVDAAGKH